MFIHRHPAPGPLAQALLGSLGKQGGFRKLLRASETLGAASFCHFAEASESFCELLVFQAFTHQSLQRARRV